MRKDDKNKKCKTRAVVYRLLQLLESKMNLSVQVWRYLST